MQPTTATSSRGEPHRLPRTVEPVEYRLIITPELDSATFTGSVDIDVRVVAETDEIVLNAAELTISDASLRPGVGETIRPQVSLDEAAERLRLRLPEPLSRGDGTVSLSFSGTLNHQLRGFYRSTFTDPEGRLRTMATTQMESTDARRAFPCWDEPDRKAIFDLTLVVDEDLLAVSNSPVASERVVAATDGTQKRQVRFAPTRPMSSYLVAFVVGPLEATGPVEIDGVPLRVVHVPGKGHLTGFALEVARHGLAYFTEYFGIPYPTDKLDLVAVPDFGAGAMENFGCVIFEETALLVDPAGASRVELERIADTIHHEIAHMWFGDLVTMAWWDGLWLNEAFATFMEVLATDAFRPAWDRWTTFGMERDTALNTDSLHSTRPIEYPVGSPEEADGMFDVLTYEKGASVLRMLEQYLGADVFRDGVRHYLRSHAYANTVTADLWQALEEVSGEPVRAVAESWILQGGHPLVVVAESSLAQEPFSFLAKPRFGESAIAERWLVPLLGREVGAHDASLDRLLLDDDPVELSGSRRGPWLANAGGWGAYRVGYTSERLGALAANLGELAPLERFTLLSDAWALVRAGRLDLGELLGIAARLGDEQEPGIYAVVSTALAMCDRIAPEGQRPLVQAATRALLGPRLASLGWDHRRGEAEKLPSLRSLLIAELGTTGKDSEVREEALRRFDAAGSGCAAVDPDLEAAVLDVVADANRDQDYEVLLERFRNPTTPQEQRRYLMALTKFPDVPRCQRTFDLALSETVRSSDAFFLIRGLLANRTGGAVIWEAVEAEWQRLLRRVPPDLQAPMVSPVRLLCTDPALARGIEQFLTTHPIAVAQRSVLQDLELLAVNQNLTARLRSDGNFDKALRGAAHG